MPADRSILVRLHSLGDVVLAQPAAAHLASTGAVTFVTRPEYLPLVERFGPGVTGFGIGREKGTGALRRVLRSAGPAPVYDLQGSFSTMLASFPSRPPRFHTDRRRRRAVLGSTGGAMPSRAEEFLAVVGGHPPAKPRLERRAEPDPAGRTAGIVCGGRWPMKSLPEGLIGELARLFIDLAGCRVLLLGGTGDAASAAGIAGSVSRRGVAIRCGSDGVAGLVRTVERLDVLVSPDSGPAHIGRALGVPTLVVFTSTSPSLGFWAPDSGFGPVAGCSPCHRHGGRRCPHGSGDGSVECRDALVPRAVFEAAVQRMTRR
jgi:ADP-heptose:LPS heptosyltransferase